MAFKNWSMQGKDWLRTRGIVQKEGQVKTAEWKEMQPRYKKQNEDRDANLWRFKIWRLSVFH